METKSKRLIEYFNNQKIDQLSEVNGGLIESFKKYELDLTTALYLDLNDMPAIHVQVSYYDDGYGCGSK